MDSKEQANSIAKNKSIADFGAKGWVTLIYCMVIYFSLSFLSNDGANVFVPVLAGSGYDPGTIYSFNTIGGWIAVPFIFVAGWVMNKNNKANLLIGLACAIVGCLCFGFIQNIWQYLIVYTLFQISANSVTMLGASDLVANWFPTRKGPAMGWATIGASLNSAINPALWGFLVILLGGGFAGLSSTFRVWGVVLVMVFLITLFVIKQNPEDAGAFPDNDKTFSVDEAKRQRELGVLYTKSSPWSIGKLLKNRQMWIIALASGIIMMITMGMISNLIAIIMSYDISQPDALKVMSATCIIGAIFSVIWGKVDAVKGTKWATIVFYFIMFAALLLLLIPNRITMFIACVAVACALGAGNNLAVSMTAAVFGRYDFAKAWSVIYPIHVIIRVCGFMLVGLIASRMGSYRPAFLVMMGFCVLAIIVMMFFKDKMIGRNTVTDEDLAALKKA